MFLLVSWAKVSFSLILLVCFDVFGKKKEEKIFFDEVECGNLLAIRLRLIWNGMGWEGV